jgi:hypothetical protein
MKTTGLLADEDTALGLGASWFLHLLPHYVSMVTAVADSPTHHRLLGCRGPPLPCFPARIPDCAQLQQNPLEMLFKAYGPTAQTAYAAKTEKKKSSKKKSN